MIILMMIFSMLVQDATKQEKDFIPYKDAYALHEKSKRPVVVIVTQPGCGHCTTMKNTLLQFKKDYPNIILTEVSLSDAKRLYPKDQTKEETRFKSTPITIMHAYDNETDKVMKFQNVKGSLSKIELYKYWKIE